MREDERELLLTGAGRRDKNKTVANDPDPWKVVLLLLLLTCLRDARLGEVRTCLVRAAFRIWLLRVVSTSAQQHQRCSKLPKKNLHGNSST